MFEPAVLSVAIILFLAVISPGPDFFIVTKTALASGSNAGFAVAFGIGVGCIFYALLCVTGLSVLLTEVAWAATLIKIAGGLYLLWLAGQVWQGASQSIESSPPLEGGVGGGVSQNRGMLFASFRTGLLTNLTNPKALAFFSSVYALAITPEATQATRTALVAVTFFILTLWFCLVSASFTLPAVRTRYLRAKKWADRLTAIVMGVFGGRLILSA